MIDEYKTSYIYVDDSEPDYSLHHKFKIIFLLIIICIDIGIYNQKNIDTCSRKGGEFIQGRDFHVCIKKDSIL